jgi:hypothetical protein
MQKLLFRKIPVMTSSIRRFIACSLMLLTCASGVFVVSETTTLLDSTSLAARYQMRSRTSNFYQRASRSRTTARPSGASVLFRTGR